MGLSNAERQARWRKRKADELAALKAKANGADQVIEVAVAPGRQRHGELMNAQLEIARLLQQLAEAHKAEPEQVAALRQRVGLLERELARRESAAKAARTKAAKVAVVSDGDGDPRIAQLEKRIAQLEKMNRDLRRENRRWQAALNEGLKKAGYMPDETRAMLVKAIHPDIKHPSLKVREEAIKRLNVWWEDNKAAG